MQSEMTSLFQNKTCSLVSKSITMSFLTAQGIYKTTNIAVTSSGNKHLYEAGLVEREYQQIKATDFEEKFVHVISSPT